MMKSQISKLSAAAVLLLLVGMFVFIRGNELSAKISHAVIKCKTFADVPFNTSDSYGGALVWYRKAAKQGYTDAQNNLGMM